MTSWPQEDAAAAASVNSHELLVPWLGDESNLVDRFDARLLLESLPAPGRDRRAAHGAGSAAAIAEAEALDPVALEALLQRERWRSLPATHDEDDVDSESSDGADNALRRCTCCLSLPCLDCGLQLIASLCLCGVVVHQLATPRSANSVRSWQWSNNAMLSAVQMGKRMCQARTAGKPRYPLHMATLAKASALRRLIGRKTCRRLVSPTEPRQQQQQRIAAKKRARMQAWRLLVTRQERAHRRACPQFSRSHSYRGSKFRRTCGTACLRRSACTRCGHVPAQSRV